MPTYVYTKPNGETVELVMRIHEMLKRQRPDGTIMIKGEECKRQYEIAGVSGLDSAKGWPIRSEALGVNPSQCEEFNRLSRENGVPTEHDASGCPVLRNRVHRKEYLAFRGARDNDGGYGD